LKLVLRRRTLLACSALLWSGLLAGCRQSATHELTILHFNDLHDHLLPDADGIGGVAHLATVLNRERAAAHASITLSAGDIDQGSPVSTLYQGVPDYEIANNLGIDVNCLGNHEFDYGWRKIRDYMQVANFPTVNANIIDASGNRMLNPPYVIREAGGMRVAVIGALLEKLLDHITKDELGPYHSAPLVETLRPIVADAKQHADMVIVLGHLEKAEAESILRGLPDVSVVVIGHEHTPWKAPVEIDGRFVIHAEGYGRQVGRLAMQYDTAARRITAHEWTGIPVDDSEYPSDPVVEAQVEKWEAKVSAQVDVPIGRSAKRFSQAETKELMERAMNDRFPSDFAFTNVNGVRDTLPEGQLLARDIWNAMPFDNHVVIAEVQGDQLMKLEGPTGTEKVAGTAKLDPARTYRLVTTDFMATTWADRGYKLRVTDQGVLLRDVFIDWIRQKKVIP
jgi:2',3'-cyclic-nucleotide 2'-phosphodiesterase (5'-nucleotidase family)